ncbi:uncharacterized protein LOC135682320 [Rhopilema esculentum]|uniref:uncharacterized protein LOC135682320 n=1 Tax=Rhopilema esculentum TaxID=499914 RepID=UPI0031DA04DC|eukprot:gene14226-5245_t
MSWNVISNSSLLRVDSFKYKSLNGDSLSGQENFAPELLEYMNKIFTNLDVGQTGYISLEDLDRHWKSNEQGYDTFLKNQYGVSSANVISSLKQIIPPNGMFNFRRFIRGMKMAVSRAKNERLRKLSSGTTLKACERTQSFGNQPTNLETLIRKVKSDSQSVLRSTSLAGYAGRKVLQPTNRPLRETRKTFFSPLIEDEDTVNESKELTSVSTDTYSDSKARKSLALDSFISASDTVDYTSKALDCTANDGSFLAAYSYLKTNPRQKENVTKDLRSNEISKRFEDPKYQGFRKTSLDKIVSQVSEKIRMMQKCLDAVDNTRDWYVRKISTLQQNRMDLRRSVFLGKTVSDTETKVTEMKDSWDSFRYEDVKRSLDTISYYNKHLQGVQEKKGSQCSSSPSKSTTTLILEKMVEGQARQIKQLETEKAALVKDLFLMKGKMNIVEKPVDQIVPF